MQYDNTPTVVVVLAQDDEGRLIAIRRNNEPGRGLIGLPGGYHMRGETWQEAGAREFREETGYSIDPSTLMMVSMETDKYGNNLVVAMTCLQAFPTDDRLDPKEVQEVVLLSKAGPDTDWAFPKHYEAANWALEGGGQTAW